jgi:hypothetical protein
VRFEFIRVEKGNFPVAIMCCALEVSRSGFYAWTLLRREGIPPLPCRLGTRDPAPDTGVATRSNNCCRVP